jgi:RNA polymerase sigma-70 factor (ECF subfamily)
MPVEAERRPSSPQARSSPFATTRWSLVAAAGEDGRAPLTELCVRYWYPVYTYARRCGHPSDVAQRIAQAFFNSLIGERLRAVGANPPPRFRAWLLDELAMFLARDWTGPVDAEAGAKLLPPLPVDLLERRHLAEAGMPASAEAGFRRSFAIEVLGRALNRLRREAEQASRLPMFERLESLLTVEARPGEYEAIAGELGTRPLALVIAVKRLRERFRELVDDELAETVTSAEGLEDERAALYSSLRPQDGQ